MLSTFPLNLQVMASLKFEHRLRNKDLAAVLNFRYILNQLRHICSMPEVFARVIQVGNTKM
ncbi:hypothetical protein PHYBLDRAFT_151960 [Phycomyces blakesleeanus NRRL 1555(-)]|uniref:Uncharacterized protein n=1 Tax=Phycomyces blakesleeanus (strain ATCC 8743b / DSM 1359 / FGSC 10004 / NBRC 33097 / NRRL 1555) TaxID=763407 RepID=A0A167K0F2_PHYB8|nr:hypothetical protein PHYBLDRAFT_151960 [Phycomyces blakesleeanus NRRL 1555(-)]OAD67018.1 hypothetical protein PHYBLDRAFT_151960 [Phycomyces blakesleeanus NRRL 1555(-)]|eukprot:XP_018285058.1 hypothetical protein PHYBLDRAFT_151960 [Phycomyces blakesleeanus NRRL 1555(-)]